MTDAETEQLAQDIHRGEPDGGWHEQCCGPCNGPDEDDRRLARHLLSVYPGMGALRVPA